MQSLWIRVYACKHSVKSCCFLPPLSCGVFSPHRIELFLPLPSLNKQEISASLGLRVLHFNNNKTTIQTTNQPTDWPIQLATKSLIEGFHQAPITIGTANIQPYKKSNHPFLAKHCPLGWILFFIKLKHAFTTISKSGLYLCSRNTVIWFVMSTVIIWFVNSIYQI